MFCCSCYFNYNLGLKYIGEIPSNIPSTSPQRLHCDFYHCDTSLKHLLCAFCNCICPIIPIYLSGKAFPTAIKTTQIEFSSESITRTVYLSLPPILMILFMSPTSLLAGFSSCFLLEKTPSFANGIFFLV